MIHSDKPSIMIKLDFWAPKVVWLWCLASFFIGSYAVELSLAIAAPLMTIFSFYCTQYMVYVTLLFQKKNTKLKRKVFDFIVYVTWGFGVFSFVYFLLGTLTTQPRETWYFFITAAPMGIGFSLGASKSWEQRFVYK